MQSRNEEIQVQKEHEIASFIPILERCRFPGFERISTTRQREKFVFSASNDVGQMVVMTVFDTKLRPFFTTKSWKVRFPGLEKLFIMWSNFLQRLIGFDSLLIDCPSLKIGTKGNKRMISVRMYRKHLMMRREKKRGRNRENERVFEFESQDFRFCVLIRETGSQEFSQFSLSLNLGRWSNKEGESRSRNRESSQLLSPSAFPVWWGIICPGAQSEVVNC